MIERNLGNIERVTRFVLGVIFAAWALSQPSMNVIEWFITFVSLALILNGIFSRCYVWYLLDLDTSSRRDGAAPTTIC
ncbi:MAG: DUF2892 domain-containing protein [Halioglobus sp.]|nr:DUF2892 domain-containing protein [Halioglobus sp.]